jgi:hypothetical protein
MTIHPLIIGGQGAYKDSCFYTEYPDRELCLEYLMEVRNLAERWNFTHIVCSGGKTQAQTPALTEAESIINYWKESETTPKISENKIFMEDKALDSSENVIFGLMKVREGCGTEEMGRIGFYSLWQFKKQRMNGLAKQLGIQERFYFIAYADADKANARDLAEEGEGKNVAEMGRIEDFVLQKPEWESKRRDRFKGSGIEYNNRTLDYRKIFPRTFEALDILSKDTIEEIMELDLARDELVEKAIKELRRKKIEELQQMFRKEVIAP